MQSIAQQQQRSQAKVQQIMLHVALKYKKCKKGGGWVTLNLLYPSPPFFTFFYTCFNFHA